MHNVSAPRKPRQPPAGQKLGWRDTGERADHNWPLNALLFAGARTLGLQQFATLSAQDVDQSIISRLPNDPVELCPVVADDADLLDKGLVWLLCGQLGA